MQKLLCIAMALMLALSAVGICSAAGKVTFKAEDVTVLENMRLQSDRIIGLERGAYFGLKGVDLTGINSIEITAAHLPMADSNGETMLVLLDDPNNGELIGTLTLTECGSDVTVKCVVKAKSGKHDVYFRCIHGKNHGTASGVKTVTFSPEIYVNNAADAKVSDDKIIDVWADTWVAVDDMGRNVADYEEVGAVKTDTREVGLMYWNWHGSKEANRADIIPEIIAKYPDAKENYYSVGWDSFAIFYWGEPVLGFYNSYDYWVYKKHAEMLANAGVDVIFFDYSNGGDTYTPTLNILAQAFRDAKATGVNVPKISAMMSLGGALPDVYRGLTSIYYNSFVQNDYSDIWYYWEGKPLLYANSTYETAMEAVSTGIGAEAAALEPIKDFFTVRYQGVRQREADGEMGSNAWMWLENFPQVLRNPDETGRPEFVVVGVGINQSTVIGLRQTGVFSDEYNKGRGYSEAFGEDYRDIGKRMAYFFREQAALALDAGPKFLMIDGWNEWKAERNKSYNGFVNSFVDLYDDENSRDIEPSRGALKDDCYNLMVDLIRKFKGVRPAPTASGMKTIDINADAAQWEGVGPEFLNNYQDYERDSKGLSKSRELVGEKHEVWHYTTTVNNAIKSAKVTFDNDNFYFMVKTEKDIKTGTDNWMHLYINADRNHATGREGYDYAVNIGGAGVVSSYNNGWTKIGDAAYTVKGNVLQMTIPRALIGETGTADIEFKWTDSVATDDILNFYSNGSVAPLGRFNYLFTEIAQTSLSDAERAALKGATVLKAGKNKMVVSGGKMTVYEPDTRIAPFESNGTLYIPEETFNEVMGYGRTKTVYEPDFNMFTTHHVHIMDDLSGYDDYTWTYGVLGSAEVKVNGALCYLSAAPVAIDGIIYVPVSMISECYGKTVRALGNGAYLVSEDAVSETAVNAALNAIA